jgi:hypothetical protein
MHNYCADDSDHFNNNNHNHNNDDTSYCDKTVDDQDVYVE